MSLLEQPIEIQNEFEFHVLNYNDFLCEGFRYRIILVSLVAIAAIFQNCVNGAEGGIRTPMGLPTRPSTVRVYQFHHFGNFLNPIIDRNRLAPESADLAE